MDSYSESEAFESNLNNSASDNDTQQNPKCGSASQIQSELDN